MLISGNHLTKPLALGSLILASALCTSTQAAPMSVEDEVRDSWIVVLNNSTPKRDVRSLAREMASQANGRIGYLYQNSIRGFSIKAPRAAIENLLRNNPNIAYIESDAVASAIGKPPGKGGNTDTPTSEPAQDIPWGVARVGGSATPTGRAWILDTGIDSDHPDLNVYSLACANFVSRGKSTCEDGNGHGTHVAGTIGAKDNAIGVVGVAPNATIVAVRVLDNNGSGTYSGVIAGVDYVAKNGQRSDVANMSLGGPKSQSIDDAIKAAAANLTFVIAAGNANADTANFSPSNIDHPNVLVVSAIDSSNTLADFSNFGANVDYAAPGVAIASTWKGGAYNTISGTSMAAPHVAGLIISGGIAGTLTPALGDKDNSPDPIASR